MSSARFLAACVLAIGCTDYVGAQQGQIGATDRQPPLGVHTHAGRRVTYVCPAIPLASVSDVDLWGTDVYLSDSPVCVAAIHAGVLQADRAGVVTVKIASGADTFNGSPQNGLTSLSYGPGGFSYTFDKSGSPGQIDWATTAVGIPETFTASIPVICPDGGAMISTIWGTDVYAEDSSICVAGVHAGLITREKGGTLFVTRAPGQSTYKASEQNGVKSTYWSDSTTSFRVSATSTALIATVAAGSPIPVAGTTSPPASSQPPIRQPIATPIVMTTICSPGKTLPGAAPAKVSSNTNFLSPAGANIAWRPVANAAGYVVERAPASGGTSVKLASTCDAGPFPNSTDENGLPTVVFNDRSGGIQPKTSYIYIVREFGSGGQMGWNSTHWTSPAVPTPSIRSVGANGTFIAGSTVTLFWDLNTTDASTKISTTEPTDFLVTSDYGYSEVLSRGKFTGCGCDRQILGVPLGQHTFTVEARWAPDVKTTSRGLLVTIAP